MPAGNVIWVRVEKPVFDLIGVFISSFTFTGICVLVALLLGGLWDAILIRRSRDRDPLEGQGRLHLEPHLSL